MRHIPVAGDAIAWVLFSLWSIYWAGVFVTAKSGYAWADEDKAPEPAYLRAWKERGEKLPRVLRWIPRAYATVWHWLTRSMFAPASRYERAPYELTGLALARVLRYVPGLYLLVRPLYPVAASHIVLAHEKAHAAQEASKAEQAHARHAEAEAMRLRIAEMAETVRRQRANATESWSSEAIIAENLADEEAEAMVEESPRRVRVATR